ncbi:MAG: DUF6090 family protein [Eudoraea sp.]
MIKFFRRIRQRLLTENKFSKYILYAIGEIVLVVIGILIALQINNWSEERKLNLQEKALLEELQKNLQSNLEILDVYITLNKERQYQLSFIINHFDQKKAYTDTIGRYLRNARIGEYLSLTTSAFESLKSVGFNVIHDEDLRMKIIELFNYTYDQNIKTIHSISSIQYQSTHEIFVKHLSFLNDDSDGKLIANDYEELIDNKEIYNLITYRIAGKTGVINMASSLQNETKELKQLVLTKLDYYNQ